MAKKKLLMPSENYEWILWNKFEKFVKMKITENIEIQNFWA